MSARKQDINGWYEVKDNPLSKVGVFPYSGAMIDSKGEFGLDPNKVYNVLRPKEELSNPETIESFKLIPWIDDHVMLGQEKDGHVPAEKKGISGVIGEDVYFDDKDDTLKGNVKVFSESLKTDIEDGKKELSLGYRCKYEKENGVLAGQSYDFVQRIIRGNHMASVDDGRMGSEVAVLDGNLLTFTIDSKELIKMEMKPEEMAEVLAGLVETVKGLTEKVEGLISSKTEDEEDPDKKAEDEEAEKKKAEDEEEEEEKKKAEDKCAEDEEKEKEDSEAMDSLKSNNKKLTKTVTELQDTVDGLKKDGVKTLMGEIGKRNALAEGLSQHIGTFDHSEMTLDEVAVYGAKKLELKCEKGTEIAAVNGFLHKRNASADGHTLDSNASGKGMDGLDDYIDGKEDKK